MASFKVESLRTDITTFLESADKNAVSAKAVRKALQKKYPELDVQSHKKAIDELTVAIFSNEIQAVENPPTPKPRLPNLSKIKKEESPEPASSPARPLSTAATRKPKREREAETDEMMARRLQEELNGVTGGRSTRNGGTTVKKTKPRKKKSKSTVSDGESGDEDKPKKKRKVSNTGFNKPHLLSPEMSEVCGKQVLSRPGVTKAIWVYIKANNLQDPNKKTDILPDATLKRVLPFERINSFTMAKHISAHLYPFDPEEHGHLVEDETLDDSKPSKELVESSDEDEK